MEALQDKNLIECYYKAVELQLDGEFIQMLLKEIKKRKLNILQATSV